MLHTACPSSSAPSAPHVLENLVQGMAHHVVDDGEVVLVHVLSSVPDRVVDFDHDIPGPDRADLSSSVPIPIATTA